MESIKQLWNKPDNLVGYGLEFYERVGKELIKAGVLTTWDKESFISLCGAYHLMNVALISVNTEGINVNSGKTEIKKNPALTIYKNASDIYFKLCKWFYLAPEPRKGLSFPKAKSEKAKKHFK